MQYLIALNVIDDWLFDEYEAPAYPSLPQKSVSNIISAIWDICDAWCVKYIGCKPVCCFVQVMVVFLFVVSVFAWLLRFAL